MNTQPLTKDARGFVDSVVSYLQHGAKSQSSAPKVKELLHRVTSSAQKEKYARVESGVALSPTEKAAIARALAKLVGHDVQVIASINPKLVSGVRIQVADWIMDTSFSHQLESMGQQIIESKTESI